MDMFSFNSLFVLVARNLWTRWVRTLLTALGIVVGVATMVAVNATNNSTLNSIYRFFDEAAGKSDLVVETAVSNETFDEAALDVVRRFPEVTAAAPVFVGVTIPADEADGWSIQFGAGGATVPGSNFWLMGRDAAADAAVHEFKLVDGRYLQPDETAYSVVLVENYAADKELAVGDDLTILTPAFGPTTLRVVGLIAKEGLGISNEGAVGIAPLPVAQELFNAGDELGQIELVVDDAIADDSGALEGLMAQLEARLGPGYDVKFPAARGALVANSLQSYQQGLNFFSVVSLFVGSFLIYNAFAMTVVERTREIGMMRAVGATSRQIARMILMEAAVLGVFGSAAGVGFGVLLARGLALSMEAFTGQPIETITVSLPTVVGAVLVGLGVTVAAALMPAWQGGRVSPLQALRVQGNLDESRWLVNGLKFGPLTVAASLLILYVVPFRSDVVFYIGASTIFVLLLGATLCIPIVVQPLERVIRPLVILVFGNEGRLGSGNVTRAQGRTTLTVAALMVGVSMVVGIRGLTNSFEQDIEEWVNTSLGGDLFVRSPLAMQPDLEARLLGLPQVTAVTPTRSLATTMLSPDGDSENVIYYAIDPDTFLSVSGLRIQEGPEPAAAVRQLAAGGRIFLSADAAAQHGLGVGDSLVLETRRGRVSFEITAVVIDFAGGDTTAITGSWGDLRRYFGMNDVTNFSVKLAPGASATAVTEIIETDLSRAQNLSVESRAEFEGKVRNLSAQAFVLFDVLSMIGLVVAALGVVNTMLMNVIERTRELGGLRSLGMEQGQVQRMILAEALTLGFIGSIFGVSFGAVLADVFVIGLRDIGGFVLTARTPVWPMVYSFLIAFGVALLAAWYPAVRASRVNIIAAIKHE